ncbi:unnamed protein product, partial [Phaeothamnion confervicola]
RRTVERLRRCQFLLNRLCCYPDIMAFLERIDPDEVPGYETIIPRPMYLRLVGERLRRHPDAAGAGRGGGYVSEHAFAMDMRLVWSNAKRFNQEGSPLWAAADALSAEFERLFCEWVLNPPDSELRTGHRPLAGPWNAWKHLQFFDGANGCPGCGRLVDGGGGGHDHGRRHGGKHGGNQEGEHAVEAAGRAMELGVVRCESCEDEWHAGCLSLHLQKEWLAERAQQVVCARCKALLDEGEQGLPLAPPSSRHGRDQVTWEPCPALPHGFQQQRDMAAAVAEAATTTAATAAAANVLYMCPTGLTCRGKAAVDAVAKAYEANV